jgi:thiamine-phosphate pyrophosphorylase
VKRGLYAIVDESTCRARGISPCDVARGALDGGATALQLRAKSLDGAEVLELSQEMLSISRGYGVPFFVNDRLDVAALVGAGVHVGQTDLPIACARRLVPSIAVGVSTHTLVELASALPSAPTYVAYGPVFPTSSKANPDPVVGLEALGRTVEIAGATPVCAIGGIRVERARDVFGRGATLVAVIAGLMPEAAHERPTISSVAERARAYHRASRLP